MTNQTLSKVTQSLIRGNTSIARRQDSNPLPLRAVIYARKSSESEDRQVMSIESQVHELRLLAERENIEVTAVVTESMSAKAPGRPIFNELYAQVQKGKIQGILCWKLDRLARNPVDGGALIWAMEENKLRAVCTPGRTFLNSGNDKFWMQLEFGMAKKYVDDLSDNVRRGIRARLAQGWVSGLPPIGYLNDRNTREIVPDSERFPVVRQMWDLLLAGTHSPPQILDIANSTWSLRTRRFKRMGGKPLTLSGVYRLFSAPFYYGMIVHKGEFFPGRHKPMISKAEFDRAQVLIHRATNSRPQTNTFAYTGLIKCGECGGSITAQRNVNRHGKAYIYYHCTRRRPGKPCSQKVVEATALEAQIASVLESITLPKSFVDWALRQYHHTKKPVKQNRSNSAVVVRLSVCQREIDELVTMRMRNLVRDDEFLARKSELENEKIGIQETIDAQKQSERRTVKQSMQLIRFAQFAHKKFVRGTIDQKRRIFAALGYNPTLSDKKLLIPLEKPLLLVQFALGSTGSTEVRIQPTLANGRANKSGPEIEDAGAETCSTVGWRRLRDDITTLFKRHPGREDQFLLEAP